MKKFKPINFIKRLLAAATAAIIMLTGLVLPGNFCNVMAETTDTLNITVQVPDSVVIGNAIATWVINNANLSNYSDNAEAFGYSETFGFSVCNVQRYDTQISGPISYTDEEGYYWTRSIPEVYTAGNIYGTALFIYNAVLTTAPTYFNVNGVLYTVRNFNNYYYCILNYGMAREDGSLEGGDFEEEHEHNWAIGLASTNIANDTVIVYCTEDGCDQTAVSEETAYRLVLGVPDLTYTGEGLNPIVIDNNELQTLQSNVPGIGMEGYVFAVDEKDAVTGGTAVNGYPVEAGYYYMEYDIGIGAGESVEAKIPFEIKKAEQFISSYPQKSYYLADNGENQALLSYAGDEGMEFCLGTEAEPNGEWSTEIPEGKDAGTYYVWYRKPGDKNHKDAMCEAPMDVVIYSVHGTLNVTIDIPESVVIGNSITEYSVNNGNLTEYASNAEDYGYNGGGTVYLANWQRYDTQQYGNYTDDEGYYWLSANPAVYTEGKTYGILFFVGQNTLTSYPEKIRVNGVTYKTRMSNGWCYVILNLGTADEDGNLEGGDFEISLEDTVVAEISEQDYTGAEIRPEVTLTYEGEELVEGVDYTVEYVNNINSADAKVVITGIGRFSGTIEKHFDIFCTAQFKTPAGDVIDTQRVKVGTALEDPSQLITDAAVLGWYNGSDAWNFEEDLLNGNIVLVAKQRKTEVVNPAEEEKAEVNTEDLEEVLDQYEEECEEGMDVKVLLVVTKEADEADAEKIEQKAGSKKYEAFDAALMLEVDGQKTDIGSSNDKLVKITYKFDFTNKKDIQVFRVHEGVAEELTETPNADGEFVEYDKANNKISITAKKYSAYAFAYNDATPKTGDGAAALAVVYIIMACLAAAAIAVAVRMVGKGKNSRAEN